MTMLLHHFLTRIRRLSKVLLLLILGATGLAAPYAQAQAPQSPSTQPAAAQPLPSGFEQAIFAGGCFWCMEPPFDHLDGVVSTTSGYTGGTLANPSYERVSAGGTGHTEAVRVVFDPKKVGYEKLLQVFWHNIDPTVRDRQFCDQGPEYRPEIYYRDEKQKELAERSKAELMRLKPFKADIVVPVTPAAEFWPAEEYHQDYYKKNPLRYKLYRSACGRDARLKELWGDQAGG